MLFSILAIKLHLSRFKKVTSGYMFRYNFSIVEPEMTSGYMNEIVLNHFLNFEQSWCQFVSKKSHPTTIWYVVTVISTSLDNFKYNQWIGFSLSLIKFLYFCSFLDTFLLISAQAIFISLYNLCAKKIKLQLQLVVQNFVTATKLISLLLFECVWKNCMI